MKRLLPFGILLSLLAFTSFAFAQEVANDDYPYQEPLKLSGPRVGVTAIGGMMGQFLEANSISPVMSQFGWQFETRYFQTRSGYQGLFEFVPLIGGLESKQTTLSINMLAGFRTPSGFEIGVGPNFAIRAPMSGNPIPSNSMVFAVGHSFRVDEVNIPVNVAFSPSANGFSLTAMVGFNIRARPVNP